MSKHLISVDEACQIVQDNGVKTQTIDLPIDACDGRRLASPIIARLTHPPVDLSAMDGFAVRFEDSQTSGQSLTIVGEATAGQRLVQSIGPGEAVRISTGGAMPLGSDHVLIKEHAVVDGIRLTVSKNQEKPHNIRRAGLDFSDGELLVARGRILGPAEIAIAAASNHANLCVVRKPMIAIIANGDELVPPGSTVASGQIISSNPSALGALLRRCGADVRFVGIAPDNRNAIATHIENAMHADVILPVGGASVGEHDHMRRSFVEMGATLFFDGVAIKPGKPSWFGCLDGKPILGLPGNPLAAYICGFIFGMSLLGGQTLSTPIMARLRAPLGANGDKTHFLLASVSHQAGETQVEASVQTDTSRLRTLLSSNSVIRRAVGAKPAGVGALVETIPLPQ